jgi:hypothetical protein
MWYIDTMEYYTAQKKKKIEPKGTLPNSFYEATGTLIPKPHKDPTKRTSDQFPL